MRSLIFVVPVLCSAAVSIGLAGCDGTVAKGAGGDGGTDDMAVSGPACGPSQSCPAVDKSCVGIVDNAGKDTFGLRMSQIDITSPDVFKQGAVHSVFAGNARPNIPACNLRGAGTFSWLLQFDTKAGTLKTGGARPIADATTGYSFDDEMIQQGAQGFHVQPTLFAGVKPDASGNFAIGKGQDLLLPVFLDPNGNSVVLLPLREARIVSGTLSKNQDCIGNYNAERLDPGNSCQPDSTHPQFTNGGKVDGYFSLEDTDAVIVLPIKQSLCAFLTGNAGMFGQPKDSNTVCKRDANGKIVFQGDWCAATNGAAGAGCADAMHFTADFAASSIRIDN